MDYAKCAPSRVLQRIILGLQSLFLVCFTWKWQWLKILVDSCAASRRSQWPEWILWIYSLFASKGDRKFSKLTWVPASTWFHSPYHMDDILDCWAQANSLHFDSWEAYAESNPSWIHLWGCRKLWLEIIYQKGFQWEEDKKQKQTVTLYLRNCSSQTT